MSGGFAPIVTPYPTTIYGGLSVTTEVPYVFPASLDGIPLYIDTRIDRWRHSSIPLLRQQADQSQSPSEASLNPAGLWRRAQDSWHRGAGQVFRDRPGSDEFRFRSSKGINPWTYYQFTLLKDTQEKRTSSNANLYITIAGSRVYITDGSSAGANVYYATSLSGGSPSFTAVTGTHATAPNGIASDGFNVWIAQGAQGLYLTNTGTGAAASSITGSVNGFVAYVKGRLLCSNNNSIYNPTGAGALPTALLTHNNTGFVWVGAAAGLRHIFMAGYAGDKSLIYRTEIKNDGTGLDTPQVASELPDGEVIYEIHGYLGNYIFLGTSMGVRFATCDTDGNLSIGSLIRTNNPVRCFEPQDRYVWFGWTNYDSVSTGLGRMDLTQFTESIETESRVPAYASDLMVTGQGNIINCVTFNNERFFSVAGDGFYGEHTNLVASGTMDSGLIAFGLPDRKTAMFVDIRTTPLLGHYHVDLEADAGGFDSIGTNMEQGDLGEEFPTNQTLGERFELRFTLDSITTTGPTITRWTLKASPGATDGPAEYIIVPFLLHRTLRVGNLETYIDVKDLRDTLKTLREQHRSVVYQEAESSYNVIVDAYEWVPVDFSAGENGGFGTPDGTMVVQLKRVFN